uniref:Aspartic proteinase nepenthesin-1 n=1 Tax=Anthurium amnicola TaxID=1678845 RepID=A0A1D1YXC9_9ARAE
MNATVQRSARSERQTLFYRDLASPISAHRGKFATPGQAAAVSALWRDNFGGLEPPPPPVFTLDERADFSPEAGLGELPASPEFKSEAKTPSPLGASASALKSRGEASTSGAAFTGGSQMSQQQQQQQQPCPYFYWYGDRSNTTGDLALETFTVNLTTDGSQRVEDVIFGCGHWNRGLFHGAAGLLGLGRGPLSFASQLRSLYGGVFSYCLVDRNSDLSVTSKLILGDQDPELMSHGHLLNFTSLVVGSGQGQGGAVDTFYYVGVKGIMVGGRMLDIPAKTWEVSPGDGSGGTIVDSGTTLSYFAEPAYGAIREAFERGVKGYPRVEGVPVLSPCYNVSGVDKVELPEFAVVFGDGAVWNFPADNYFIRLEPEGVVCLALLGTSTLSILGNYQQQNFHVVYDAGRSRLGFAPATCADL